MLCNVGLCIFYQFSHWSKSSSWSCRDACDTFSSFGQCFHGCSGKILFFWKKTLISYLPEIFFLTFQKDEVPGFNALTIYILICMIFIAMAMAYYGMILFMLRRIKNVHDSNIGVIPNEDKLSNSIIKGDRLMIALYVIAFIIFNLSYFIKNLVIFY